MAEGNLGKLWFELDVETQKVDRKLNDLRGKIKDFFSNNNTITADIDSKSIERATDKIKKSMSGVEDSAKGTSKELSKVTESSEKLAVLASKQNEADKLRLSNIKKINSAISSLQDKKKIFSDKGESFLPIVKRLDERIRGLKLAKQSVYDKSASEIDRLTNVKKGSNFEQNLRREIKSIESAIKEAKKAASDLQKEKEKAIKGNPLSLYGDKGLAKILKEQYHKEQAQQNRNSSETNAQDEKFVRSNTLYCDALRARINLIDQYIDRLKKQKEAGVNVNSEIGVSKLLRNSMASIVNSSDESKAAQFLSNLYSGADKDVRKFDQLYQLSRKLSKEIEKLRKVEGGGISGVAKKGDVDLLTKMEQELRKINGINLSNLSEFSNTKGLSKGINELIDASQRRRNQIKDENKEILKQNKSYKDLETAIRSVNSSAAKLANDKIKGNGGDFIEKALREISLYKAELRNALNTGDFTKINAALENHAARWHEVTNVVERLKALQVAYNKENNKKKPTTNNNELSLEMRKLQVVQRLKNEIDKINFKKEHKIVDEKNANNAIERINEYIQKVERLNASSSKRVVTETLGGSYVSGALQQARNYLSINNDINKSFVYQSRLVSELHGLVQQYFSIYAIKSFLNDLIVIGGEFEKQHVALRTMIGDISAADTIYSQLQQYAIKSPFEFKDVVSQTKQLTAFGVETENLMDTMERLGNIAAGLGVDFGRLSLAYGETKARGWLDGKELRQFAYMGIPLLQKLSEHYTKLAKEEGKAAVSAADVRKMMRKGEVSFETVKEILWKMTDAGGMFYKMQETMADTVVGRWKNLGDAYDVMLSQIEAGNSHILKPAIDMMFQLMKEWETWLPIVSALTVGITLYTGAAGLATLSTKALTASWVALGTAAPWVAAVSAIVGVSVAIAQVVQNSKRLENEWENLEKESHNNFASASMELSILKARLKETEGNTKEYDKVVKELVAKYPTYLKDIEKEGTAYDILASKIDNAITKIREKAAADLYAQKISVANKMYEENQIDLVESMSESVYAEGRKTVNGKVKELTKGEAHRVAELISQIIIEDPSRNKNDGQVLKEAMEKAGLSKLGGGSNLFHESVWTIVRQMRENANALKNAQKEAKATTVALYGDFQEIMNTASDFGDSASSEGTTTQDNNQKQKTDNQLKEFNKRLQNLKKLLQEYETLKKLYGESVAKDRISLTDAYKDLAKTFGISDISDEKGSLGFALNYLKKIGLTSDDRKSAAESLSIDIDNIGIKLESSAVENAKKDLERQLKDITSKWDLYTQWLDATGDKELAARMVGGVSFENSVKEYEKVLDELLAKKGSSLKGGDLLKLYQEEGIGSINSKFGENSEISTTVQKLGEEYDKLSEKSSKALLDIVKNHQSYASKIKSIDDKLAEDIANINGSGLSADEKENTIEGLNRDAKEKRSEILFEQFKSENDWVKIYEDLDRVSTDTINDMIEKIGQFANNSDLAMKVVKELQNAMKKLRNESIERNPFKAFTDSQNRVSQIKLMLKSMDSRGQDVIVDSGVVKSREDLLNELQAEYDTQNKSIEKAVNSFEALNKVVDIVADTFDSLGAGDLLKDISGVIGGVLGGASNGLGAGKAVGEASGAFKVKGLEKAGAYGAVAGAALSLISGIAGLHDKALQKEIEASERRQKEMESLSKNLEKVLGDTLGGVYSSKFGSGSSSYYQQQLSALVGQRDELQKQYNLENDKKKSDKSKLDDYKQGLIEINAEIDTFAKDLADALYGIDFKSWADDLADALVDAWASGEDAATAWKDKVNDLLKSVTKSVISQKFVQQALEQPMENFIAKFRENNGLLSENELDSLANDLYGAYDGLAKAVPQFLEALKSKGLDLSDTANKEKSGLSAGIQSITESTADLLASYVNTIRADVSVMRELQESFYGGGVIAESQLQQLNLIAQNTGRNAQLASDMYDLLKAVTNGTKKFSIA